MSFSSIFRFLLSSKHDYYFTSREYDYYFTTHRNVIKKDGEKSKLKSNFLLVKFLNLLNTQNLRCRMLKKEACIKRQIYNDF